MIEEKQNKISIKDRVLEKIESGQVGMKSKTYFMIKLALLGTVVALIVFISVFLLSFIIFSMSLDGSLFLVRFGGVGLYHFFLTLPWFMLALDILLLVLLDWILKSFKFGYRSPVIYLFIETFVVITAVSTLLNFTSFHQLLKRQLDKDEIPQMFHIYSDVRSEVQKPGTWKGFVGKIDGNKFSFSYIKGISGEMEQVEVFALPDVDVDAYLNPGDLVFVAGSLSDGEIKAYGMKKLSK